MSHIKPHQYQHLANGVRRIRECCNRAWIELYIADLMTAVIYNARKEKYAKNNEDF